jgi:hypothetical protein
MASIDALRNSLEILGYSELTHPNIPNAWEISVFRTTICRRQVPQSP